MEDEKREIRNTASPLLLTDVENEESRTVEGYALVFDTRSDGLSFEEVIDRGALDGVVEKSDVYALLNHSFQRGILARDKYGKGPSLTLTVDNRGLMYRFDAPRTALGDELLENLRRGEINESSFAFDVESDTWEKKDDGTWKRTIHKIGRLYDVSPVYAGAYSKTSVYTRGKDEAEAREREMPDSYYKNLEKAIY